MKDNKHPRIFATIVCAALALAMSAVAAGRGRTRLPAGNLSFATGTAAVSTPQTGGRKRSSRRKRAARPAKAEETKTGPTINQTQAQPALPSSQGPLSQVHYDLPIRKPGPGEEQARGLLERVDCNGNVATFTVQAGARTLKLHAANFNAVQYKTYTPEVSGDISCGVRNPANNVVVTFRPAKEARAKFDGDVVAVEFVPKDFQLKK
jgi:hypothetical protein